MALFSALGGAAGALNPAAMAGGLVSYGSGTPSVPGVAGAVARQAAGGDWWSQNLPQINEDGSFSGGGMEHQPRIDEWKTYGDYGGGTGPIASQQPGGQQNVSIDQIKQLVGSDYSPEHLKQILPQLQALGVEVQNQQRGDLRPRFLLPGGEQWDFGSGGWINSGHGIKPGFGDASQAPSRGMGGASSFSALGGMSPSDYLHNTPGYQFALDEGLKGVERSSFGRGIGLTGGAGKRLLQYGIGYADQGYGNAFQRFLDLAKLGQQSAGGATE